MERWLTQRLSHRLGAGPRGGDGVCAGVRFLNPRSLVSLLLGRESDDPWDPERLVWPLLATIDDSLDDVAFATLAKHLGHGLDGPDAELRRNRRYSVALRLASLFASYAVQRPSLVTAWRDGDDGDLAPDLLWQAELWRRLLPRVDAPPPDVRHAETVRRLQAGGDDLPLPGRLTLFGHTRIPVTEVELLRALGEHRDVHLFLPQPSPVLWDDLAGLGGVVARADDTSADRVGHPLLASLGRDARELRRTLDGIPSDEVADPRRQPATRCSAGSSRTCAPTTRRRTTSGPAASSPRPTAACRCTRATARRGRSTCSARCWSGCSRTTRPWSRATSW